MSYTAYCLVYVLNNHYRGNKTKMAGAMQMLVPDFFKQFRRVVTEGRDSPTMLERINELCGREGINMNEVWAGFSADPHLEPMEVAPCPYYPTMKDLDHRISDMIENIHKQQQMLRVAKETRRLMIEIRGACCGFNLDKDGSTLCHKYRKYLENGVVDKAGMMDCACMYLSAMLQGLGEA